MVKIESIYRNIITIQVPHYHVFNQSGKTISNDINCIYTSIIYQFEQVFSYRDFY